MQLPVPLGLRFFMSEGKVGLGTPGSLPDLPECVQRVECPGLQSNSTSGIENVCSRTG